MTLPIPRLSEGIDPSDWAIALSELDGTDKANIILQIVGDHTDFENTRDFKLLACELAETLGPDHAQTLYRLAVLTTKLV